MFIQVETIVFLFVIWLKISQSKLVSQIVRIQYGDTTIKRLQNDYYLRKAELKVGCGDNNMVPRFLSFRLSNRYLLNFTRPSENKILNIHDQVGIKLLTRLRLGLSHLREHKFRHNFEDILNPLCSCCIEGETTLHCFILCQFFNDIRETLMNDLMNTNRSLPSLSKDKLISILLYGSNAFDIKKNLKILICTIQFIKDSHRFDNSLFYSVRFCQFKILTSLFLEVCFSKMTIIA